MKQLKPTRHGKQAPAHPPATLVAVAGPAIAPLVLPPGATALILGRQDDCELRLAADTISRRHARLRLVNGQWVIADLGSRWGTHVNGVRLQPQREHPLAEGDLLLLSPWTLRFSVGERSDRANAAHALDDHDLVGVNTIVPEKLPALDSDLLQLLLKCAGDFAAAPDESSLVPLIVELACRGSGLPNASLLRPLDASGRFEVVAFRTADGSKPRGFSRSLISTAASRRELAELSTARQDLDLSQSLVSMGVSTALCVPLVVGEAIAAFLYLDSRSSASGSAPRPLRPHAASFCAAMAKMASLALASLRRTEMELRGARFEAELAAAAAAQRWILPPNKGHFGPFTYAARSVAGEYLGGDFYDVVSIDGDRLFVAIGDVSGHGAAASMLMTASAGFLNAVLQRTDDASDAVDRLNRFVCPRTPSDRFLTLWVGLLDLPNRTLHYVDAGHGFTLLGDSLERMEPFATTEHFPIGVEQDYHFAATRVSLPQSGRLLLVSDGIVEQFNPGGKSSAEQFGLAGVQRALSDPATSDPIEALFASVRQHANGSSLADDATAVLVSW